MEGRVVGRSHASATTDHAHHALHARTPTCIHSMRLCMHNSPGQGHEHVGALVVELGKGAQGVGHLHTTPTHKETCDVMTLCSGQDRPEAEASLR